MKLSRRTNTVILWILVVALLVGMVIMFTPTVGNIFAGGTGAQQGSTVLLVNNEPIREMQVARVQQQNRLFTSVAEGRAADDLQLLLLDSLIDQELLRQASARTRVSSGDVRDAVNEWRAANNVAGRQNDQRYLGLIGQMGFTDQTFRQSMEAQLRQDRFLAAQIGDVTVSDEEVRSFYEANRETYTSEERIRARQIVVDDEATANELYARLLAGEEFAAVAREHSAERADRDGALGAAAGSTEPEPVGRTALPSSVATAAFALQGSGLTDIVTSGGRYYIVQVEEYLPAAPRAFEDVEGEVREDALAAKRLGREEAVLRSLRENATIRVPEGSPYRFENDVVAVVGDREILRSELARATYLNPQIQQFLSPQTASLVTDFFQPSVLEQLIDRELAVRGARDLDVQLVGSDDLVAQSALNFVARDADATDAEIRAYYDANRANFTVGARAVVTQVRFADQESAQSFRDELVDAEAVDDDAVRTTAQARGGTVESLGTVFPGQLDTTLDAPLFATNAFEPLDSATALEVSDILVIATAALEDATEVSQDDALEATVDPDEQVDDAATADEVGADAESDAETEAGAGEEYVVLVAVRTSERVRPLEEVRDQVRRAVLAQERQELREAWLNELRAETIIDNRLAPATQAPGVLDGGAFVFEDEAPTEVEEPTVDTAGEPEADAAPDAQTDGVEATEEGAVDADEDETEDQ